MSGMERIKSERLRFLQAVYHLAEGTPSHGVRGTDIAVRLGLDVASEVFHSLAYYHQKAGNTEALETNWGLIVLTIKGIAEVESSAGPAASQQDAAELSTQRPDVDYLQLLPHHSSAKGRGSISRKTARALATTVLNTFSYQYDAMSSVEVQHSDLYDFLYENNYPIWFAEDSERYLDERSIQMWIMKLQTGGTIKDIFPDLGPAELNEIGQTYLQKVSEDILNHYVEELGEVGPEWNEYPPHLRRLRHGLELDGFIFRNARLLNSETNVLAEEEERGVLESLYRSLDLQNEQTAFHHLDLSEQHYLAGKWDDPIGNSRKFLETVLREVAAAYHAHRHNTSIPRDTYEWPKNVRNYLENEGLITNKEKEVLIKVYGLLSETGGHPHMARNDQARLLRNLALTLSQFVMLRFQGNASET